MRRISGPTFAAFAALALASSSARTSTTHSDLSTKPPLVSLSYAKEAEGVWSRGLCTYSDGYVTYSSFGGIDKDVRLDVTVFSPKKILCSSDFTVIFDSYSFVVAIGADAQTNSLGFIGGLFVAANSYRVSILPILDDGGVADANLKSNILTITTNSGSVWKLDLSNPFTGWQVY